jgi:pimeloyl-ACP methyl ester carboxylesterase
MLYLRCHAWEVEMPAPTVILVHGTFLGPWSWKEVVDGLTTRGIESIVVDLPSGDPSAQPEGDLHADVHAVRAAMASATGPFVLCGHSYGGAVITEAAVPSDGVAHLVYLAGAAPDAGESLADLAPDSADDQGESVRFRDDGMIELTHDAALAALFHDCEPVRAQQAVERLRPSNPAVSSQQVAAAGWRAVPATFVRCTDDRVPELVSPDFEATADVVALGAGHCPNWSRPDDVIDLLVGIVENATAPRR